MDDTVTLGDKKVEIVNYDRYKGRKNVTDRIAFLSTGLIRGWIHYHEVNSKRHLFFCHSEKDKEAICCKELGLSQQRFGMVLFKYHTQEDGTLLDDTKCQGKLFFWLISEARYEELSGLNKQWSLMDGGFASAQVDLLIKCTEEDWQRMTFTPCPQAHWKKKEPWYNALKGKEAKTRDRLKAALGKKLSIEEVQDLLGKAPVVSESAPPTQSAGDVNLSELIEEI